MEAVNGHVYSVEAIVTIGDLMAVHERKAEAGNP